jgi:hypothetical protein
MVSLDRGVDRVEAGSSIKMTAPFPGAVFF